MYDNSKQGRQMTPVSDEFVQEATRCVRVIVTSQNVDNVTLVRLQCHLGLTWCVTSTTDKRATN